MNMCGKLLLFSFNSDLVSKLDFTRALVWVDVVWLDQTRATCVCAVSHTSHEPSSVEINLIVVQMMWWSAGGSGSHSVKRLFSLNASSHDIFSIVGAQVAVKTTDIIRDILHTETVVKIHAMKGRKSGFLLMICDKCVKYLYFNVRCFNKAALHKARCVKV